MPPRGRRVALEDPDVQPFDPAALPEHIIEEPHQPMGGAPVNGQPRTPDPEPPSPPRVRTRYTVPDDNEFADDQTDTLAEGIREIANELILAKPALQHLQGLGIVYLYRRKGGKSKGKAHLGECQALTGPHQLAWSIALNQPIDFLVWIAADHTREFDPLHLTAIVFHELKHIERDPEDPENYRIRGHDFEGFLDELAEFGPWHTGLRNLTNTARQLSFTEADLLSAPAVGGQA
jgi:hypothetical protein